MHPAHPVFMRVVGVLQRRLLKSTQEDVPGFQLIDEVVENDYFFRCTFDNLANCDLLLAIGGPQYWGGADRATIHAGAAAVSTPSVLPGSVGAFATIWVVSRHGRHSGWDQVRAATRPPSRLTRWSMTTGAGQFEERVKREP